jgi:ParB family transcriptional regulator, chromosome partitioning protein
MAPKNRNTRAALVQTTMTKAQDAQDNTVASLRQKISELEANSNSGSSEMVDPKLISPSPYQCRSFFDPDKLLALQASIQERGIITPLVGRLVNNQYELIAGEMRLRSALSLGLPLIPFHLLDNISDSQAAELVLIENLKRSEISPVEEARSVMALLVSRNLAGCESISAASQALVRVKNVLHRQGVSSLTDEDNEIFTVAYALIEDTTRGKWASFVSNKLPLLELGQYLQNAMVQGLPYTKAKLIASFEKDNGEDAAKDLLSEVIDQNLSVSNIRKRLTSPTPDKKFQAALSHIQTLEHNLHDGAFSDQEKQQLHSLLKSLLSSLKN